MKIKFELAQMQLQRRSVLNSSLDTWW